MVDCRQLREQLEEFKRDQRAELDLGPIEKWMLRELGVQRIPVGKGPGKKTGSGSVITYYHPKLECYGYSGRFTVHKRHKKREIILRINFRKFLYPRLAEIISVMELECKRGD